MRDSKKLVSVIVPAYNVENFIDKCLASILSQTYKDIEVIVVDDGSDDGTWNRIESYAQKDSRVRGFHRENSGVSATRNYALERANGFYIQFVDGDDYIEENAVETLVSAIETSGADWVNCQYHRLGENDGLLEEFSFITGLKDMSTEAMRFSLVRDQLINYAIGYEVWDKLFLASIIRDNSISFIEDCHMGEDLAFNICYACHAPAINCIEDRLYNYRVRSNSAMDKAKSLSVNFKEHLALVKGIQPYFERAFSGEVKGKFYQLFYKLMLHASEGHTAVEAATAARIVSDDYYSKNLSYALKQKDSFLEFYSETELEDKYAYGATIKELLEPKHAYLIMAHSNFESLKYLLQGLDDKKNDIYIHIDKKTKYANLDEISSWVNKSGLYFTDRLDITWGHISVVKAELYLLKFATSNRHYHYYHLLSGMDYPIKSQKYIHDFLYDKDLQFVSFYENGQYGDEFIYKLKYFYPFMKWLGRGDFKGPGKKLRFMRWLNRFEWRLVAQQKKLGIDRTKKYPDIHFVKGAEWFSITDDFARYILSKREDILKIFGPTNTPDEFFIQTMGINSSFKNRIAGYNLREIDWQRGTPYEYTHEELDELKQSNNLFSRKISYENNPLLVRGLMEHIGVRERAPINTNPLVTVVVPIYNVAEYLQQCLDSLVGQSYTNLQVVMVDDGSEDGATQIAKAYADKDPRFQYFYQENQGLSAARNTGIEKASGEYITFVDSDDWVQKDYIKSMLDVAIEKDADITVCGFEMDGDVNRVVAYSKSDTFSGTEAMRTLGNIFTDEYLLMVISWNKLFKRALFDNVRFTVGKIHEDEYVIHRLIAKADLLCTVDKTLYNYRIRQDSITGAQKKDDLRHFDIVDAHLDRVKCCQNQMYGQFYRMIVYSLFEEVIQLMCRYSDAAYKKYGLNKRFRELMLRLCLEYYSQFDKHQKKEYLRAICNPRGYARWIQSFAEK